MNSSVNLFFSSLISKRNLPVFILTLLLLAATIVSLCFLGWQTMQNYRSIQLTGEMQTLSQQLPLLATTSTGANEINDKVSTANQVLVALQPAAITTKFKMLPQVTEEDLLPVATELQNLETEVNNTLAGNYDYPNKALYAASASLLTQSNSLIEQYESVNAKLKSFHIVPAIGAILTILLLIRLFYNPAGSASGGGSELAEMEEQTRQNQDAILRLLDEMGDLADGDLTVTATVTEDMTGAIADSINYTIDALRELVTNINTTTLQVSSAAQESQATSMHLTEASEHQAEQISEVTVSITDMATAIEQVASDAGQSAEVANQSVALATEGNAAVQKSIQGMDTIREQIQETSKRIKRLGESSQQIGEIVELINDIAEQTNVLSLNAAIQAAMAGEAGRGFAVVADEVQRLAERSGNATKQIDALVKAIQSDTNEAITSMERSTTEVVSGANLSQAAGTALAQIETVSHQLAELIDNISTTAKAQSAEAVNTSDRMNVIQEITMQTSSGTNETAASIGRLSELADELRKSVSGFKLP